MPHHATPRKSNSHAYVIVGPRGSGMTAFMTNVSNSLARVDGWISVELSPERNLLESLVAKPISVSRLVAIFCEAKIKLSLLGLGVQIEGVSPRFRQHLDDYVYDKILSELSAGNRRLAVGIAKSESGRIADARGILDMKRNQFNPCCRRLMRKGIITGEERGYVRFALPCFEDYAIEHEE